MAVTLPKIEVTFKQLAASFVRRSERGIAVLILRDATEGSGESFFRFGDATRSRRMNLPRPTSSISRTRCPSARCG